MKYLFYCCKYLYCEINESEMSRKKKQKKQKKKKKKVNMVKHHYTVNRQRLSTRTVLFV